MQWENEQIESNSKIWCDNIEYQEILLFFSKIKWCILSVFDRLQMIGISICSMISLECVSSNFTKKTIFQKLQKRQKKWKYVENASQPTKKEEHKNRQNKILSLFQIQFKCNNIKWAKSTHAWSLTKCEQISVEIIEWIAFWIFLFVECSFSRVWPLRCTGTLWLLLLLSCT